MEWVILGVLIGLGGLVAVFFLGLGGVAKASSDKTRRENENAPELLDKAFDGRDVATWRFTGGGGLTQEQVIEGAAERGYRMTGSAPDGKYMTVVTFEKRP